MIRFSTRRTATTAAAALLACTAIGACAPAADDSAPSYADDRAAIENLNATYLFAFDWDDADAYAATFAPDGVLDYGGGPFEGREAIHQLIAERRGAEDEARAGITDGTRLPVGRHMVTNQVITVDGDTAHQVAYWTHMTADGKGGSTVDSFGHYEDELVRIDGKWFYASRHIYNENFAEWAASFDNPVSNPNPLPRRRMLSRDLAEQEQDASE